MTFEHEHSERFQRISTLEELKPFEGGESPRVKRVRRRVIRSGGSLVLPVSSEGV